MGADKTDQPGVLGNLPRSRPGQRSEKRAAVAAKAAETATARKRARAPKRASTARKPASAAPPRRARAGDERAVPEPAPTPGDPLTIAFRTAGKVAELGLKTAGGILRRLPGR